ncbi:hypothetical protein MRX96_037709 [Rhipicephalus microplus]
MTSENREEGIEKEEVSVAERFRERKEDNNNNGATGFGRSCVAASNAKRMRETGADGGAGMEEAVIRQRGAIPEPTPCKNETPATF